MYNHAMSDARTTAILQSYLDRLDTPGGDVTSTPVVRELLGRSVARLQMLCGTMLHQRYHRLTRPPLNLRTEELLSAVVERLIKALQKAKPGHVRQFFAIANQHIRWELNDLARRLDEETRVLELQDDAAHAPQSSGAPLSPGARRMLEAIENLPNEEREVFELVRVQGLTQTEAAEIAEVSSKTVQRRLNRALILLSESLADLDASALSRDRSVHGPG